MRFWRHLFMFATLLLSCAVPAQTTNNIVIPFDYANRHLYITVTDAHLGPLTLMLDTGFQRTSLAASVARKGQVHTHFWERSLDYNGFGAGPTKRRYQTTDVSLRSAQTTLFAGSALITDFAPLAKELGHPLDGFLGWDFFRHWCATLDYAPARLTLRDPAHCAEPSGPHAVLRAEWTPQGLLLPAHLTFANGHTAAALLHFDTGSDITLLLNTQFHAPAGVDQKNSSALQSHGFGVNGGYITDLVSMHKIDLGGQLQLSPGAYATIAIARPGAFAKVHWWEGPAAARINHDGIIGNGLLDRFRWTFDPAARRIYAEPAAER
jgi:hypothetical protein